MYEHTTHTQQYTGKKTYTFSFCLSAKYAITHPIFYLLQCCGVPPHRENSYVVHAHRACIVRTHIHTHTKNSHFAVTSLLSTPLGCLRHITTNTTNRTMMVAKRRAARATTAYSITEGVVLGWASLVTTGGVGVGAGVLNSVKEVE